MRSLSILWMRPQVHASEVPKIPWSNVPPLVHWIFWFICPDHPSALRRLLRRIAHWHFSPAAHINGYSAASPTLEHLQLGWKIHPPLLHEFADLVSPVGPEPSIIPNPFSVACGSSDEHIGSITTSPLGSRLMSGDDQVCKISSVS